jgi:adenylate kinase
MDGPPRHLVFLGPPGAGKGTQAVQLARDWHLAHLSTGDLLRAAVAQGTPLGLAASAHIQAGRLVPDDLVLEILGERIGRPDARAGFVLDGFPRTLAQARALDAMATIDAVISFELPEPVLLERLAGRRICPKCGTVYHVSGHPPREEGRCDHDGVELLQRPDDRPEAVAVRLRVYAEQTEPVLAHYRARGLVRPLLASGSPGEVARRLRALLDGA